MSRNDSAAAQAEEYRHVYRQILQRMPESQPNPSLVTITTLLGLLGDPQQDYPSVHVAGTNGKTSTTRLAERLLREHGLRTGMFTSPHLVDPTERIAIDGEPISAATFLEVYREIEPALSVVDAQAETGAIPGLTRPSFFEVLVAMALVAFSNAAVDVAVVEVGIGGTWDATNVLAAEIDIITPISLDHQHLLGDTLVAIAEQKAGIIAHGATVIMAEQADSAGGVIRQRADAMAGRVVADGCEIGVLRRELAVGGQLLDLQGRIGRYDEVFLSLHGEHQAHNAVLALAAAETLMDAGGSQLEPELVRAAFAEVTSPGRLEVVRASPTLVVDAAHNPAGAQALAEALAESFAFTRLIAIVGVLSDKDASGILQALQPVVAEVVVTEVASARTLPVDDLADLAKEIFGDDRVHLAAHVADAVELAVTRAEVTDEPTSAVIITGSVALVGQARALLQRPRFNRGHPDQLHELGSEGP